MCLLNQKCVHSDPHATLKERQEAGCQRAPLQVATGKGYLVCASFYTKLFRDVGFQGYSHKAFLPPYTIVAF